MVIRILCHVWVANSGSRNSKRFGVPCSVLCLDAHGKVRQATHIHWMPRQKCHHLLSNWQNVSRLNDHDNLVECSYVMVVGAGPCFGSKNNIAAEQTNYKFINELLRTTQPIPKNSRALVLRQYANFAKDLRASARTHTHARELCVFSTHTWPIRLSSINLLPRLYLAF